MSASQTPRETALLGKAIPADLAMWEVHVAALVLPAGIRMTGFKHRNGGGSWKVQVPPAPRAGIVMDCTAGSLHRMGLPMFKGGVVAGIVSEPARMASEGIEVLEVELDPVAADRLFDIAPADLPGPGIDLQDLWGREAEYLREQLIAVVSWPQRFVMMRSALVTRLRPESHVDPEIADAWQLITESGGQLRIAALAQRYNWSRHRLWRRFTEQVGVSPKQVAKIARFDRALSAIGSGTDLSRVANECGYADQAHMSREIKELSGHCPREIAADSLRQFHSSLSPTA